MSSGIRDPVQLRHRGQWSSLKSTSSRTCLQTKAYKSAGPVSPRLALLDLGTKCDTLSTMVHHAPQCPSRHLHRMCCSKYLCRASKFTNSPSLRSSHLNPSVGHQISLPGSSDGRTADVVCAHPYMEHNLATYPLPVRPILGHQEHVCALGYCTEISWQGRGPML